MGLVSYTYGDTGEYSILCVDTPDGAEYHVLTHGEISARTVHIAYLKDDAEKWVRTAEKFQREAGVRPEQFVCIVHATREEE